MNRNQSIDAVKGFAILVVMLGHCIVLNQLADPIFYDGIVAIQMPLFMAVSGYLMGMRPLDLTMAPDIKKTLASLGRRSVSYLVPFFAWMVITSFPHCLAELKAQLFQTDRGLWFLMTLWVIQICHTLVCLVSDAIGYKIQVVLQQKKYMASLVRWCVYFLCILVVYAGFFLQGRSRFQLLSPSLTVKYMPFYVVAYAVAAIVIPFWATKKECIRYILLDCLCAVLTIVFIYLIYRYDMIIVHDTMTLLAQMVASFAGTIICFYVVYRFAQGKLQKALAFIGQFTLEIYVLHFRFARMLGLANRNLEPFAWNTILWIGATFLVMSILTALCIWVIKKIPILDFVLFGKLSFQKTKATASSTEKQ